MAQGNPHQIFYGPPDKSEMGRHEQQVFGAHARRHPITDMPLEMGSGALLPDEQALRVHLPEIERTRGKEVADAMRIRLAISQRHRAIDEKE
jgi:hypothetical protein